MVDWFRYGYFRSRDEWNLTKCQVVINIFQKEKEEIGQI